MKTTAVRLYGKDDLRLESFELPQMGEDQILAKIVSDSICMSTYKAVKQGTEHKRVPKDAATKPIIVGHEFCGEIIDIGEKWIDKYQIGDKFTVQTALNYKGSLDAPGYSYQFTGGNATYILLPNEVMELDCLLTYSGEAYFCGSLAEPMSCIVGAFHASYHTEAGSYVHKMGIKPGGKAAILAGAGPMGMGAIDYAIHADIRPSLLVVTDIDSERLERVEKLYPASEAKKNGVDIIYVNTGLIEDPHDYLMTITEGQGYDDVFCFAPVRSLVELADSILGKDGCLNFFAGPTDKKFSALFNFYNVHYSSTHVVGTSGGTTSDMIESLEMMGDSRISPASMITHIGGLDSVIDTVMKLPSIPGGKKLIYTHISMPLTAISDFAKLADADPLFAELSDICTKHNGLWNVEAERHLLKVKEGSLCSMTL